MVSEQRLVGPLGVETSDVFGSPPSSWGVWTCDTPRPGFKLQLFREAFTGHGRQQLGSGVGGGGWEVRMMGTGCFLGAF